MLVIHQLFVTDIINQSHLSAWFQRVLFKVRHWFQSISTNCVHVILSTKSCPALIVDISVNGKIVSMEVDTGAGASVIPLQLFLELFPALKLSRSCIILTSASGPIQVVGETAVSVRYLGEQHILPLIICKDLPLDTPLMGRPWLDILIPSWREFFSTSRVAHVLSEVPPSVDHLKEMFPKVFATNSDSPIVGFSARLVLKADAKPVKHRAYRVPFALDNVVNSLLDGWVKSDTAVHVRQAEWASPGFPVPKKDGTYRLVVDFKKTLNPQLRIDHYPIPAPDEIFAALSDSAVFVSLDLKDAYTQLELHPDSQELCVVNTPRGFFRLKRLIYGVSSAASIFQSVIEEIVLGIPGVKVYLDNILIHASSMSVLIQRTFLVLAKLDKHNVRLKESKCEWFVDKFEFLGFYCV